MVRLNTNVIKYYPTLAYFYSNSGDMNLNGRLNQNDELTSKDAFFTVVNVNTSENVLAKVYSSSITLSRAQCVCDLDRAIRQDCNAQGDCNCRVGYTGSKCEGCTQGYYLAQVGSCLGNQV